MPIDSLKTHHNTSFVTAGFPYNHLKPLKYPNQNTSHIPFLAKADERLLLIDWNTTKADYPEAKCIHTLFEWQANHTPDATAVVYDGQGLTYAELNRKASQLARYLQKYGVGPEILIGICMERSLEMMIGLLGILKAGGAYVPLDPSLPESRLAYTLKDAQINVLLTQSHLLGSIPNYENYHTSCLDRSWGEISQEDSSNPISKATPSNLVYVMYTSGSTGTPKGVMIEHKALFNRLYWMQETFQLNRTNRVLQKTPFAFDVSVWEFFWPCLAGATLVFAKPEGHKDAGYLVDTIMQRNIDTIHFVPSMLEAFVQHPSVSTCNSLKRIICSGEALSHDLKQRLLQCLPDAELYNLYGPTEATIDVSWWNCRQQTDKAMVPIGRPVANTQLLILDNHLNLMPIGAPGELYIGGVQLARGYLNRPELTQERFIPNPFPKIPSQRLYKTGDRCRYLSDGAIEYLGRLDSQIKLRGYRIELGEIESILTQHQQIQQAIVLLTENHPGHECLVAYLVATSTANLCIDDLRDHLKNQLPDYMIPSAFVCLDQLPLMANGKIDRKALPRPSDERLVTAQTYIAPRTPIEELLCQIWQDVLSVDKVGVNDNFFDLGGHSLLGTMVMSRVASLFGIDFPLLFLFELPTIANLAQSIENHLIDQFHPDELSEAIAELDDLSDNDVEQLLSIEAGRLSNNQLNNSI